MKKLSSSLPNMVIVLTVTTLLAGLLLGWVNSATADARAAAENEKRVNALQSVAGSFDNDPMAEAAKITLADGRVATVYPTKVGDDFTGGAVEITTPKGFSGDVTIIVGFNADGEVLGYEVTSHAETPGLGAKMGEWFRGDARRSVIGRKPWETNLVVSKDGGDIDAITAATISSRAFLGAVNDAASAMQLYEETLK